MTAIGFNRDWKLLEGHSVVQLLFLLLHLN
jgi:hypothetical protein